MSHNRRSKSHRTVKNSRWGSWMRRESKIRLSLDRVTRKRISTTTASTDSLQTRTRIPNRWVRNTTARNSTRKTRVLSPTRAEVVEIYWIYLALASTRSRVDIRGVATIRAGTTRTSDSCMSWAPGLRPTCCTRETLFSTSLSRAWT